MTLGDTNSILHSSVKNFLCTLWSLALAKKSCNNINNSRAQVTRLCISCDYDQIKNILCKNHAKNVKEKLVLDIFIILVNNPKQPFHARNSFKSKIFLKTIIKKPLKRKLYFFFRTQFLSTDKIIKNKRGLELVPSCYSGYETSSEKFHY